MNGKPERAIPPIKNVQNVVGIFLRKPPMITHVLRVGVMVVDMLAAMFHAMNDGAGSQEQQRLEETMRNQVESSRRRKRRCQWPPP